MGSTTLSNASASTLTRWRFTSLPKTGSMPARSLVARGRAECASTAPSSSSLFQVFPSAASADQGPAHITDGPDSSGCHRLGRSFLDRHGPTSLFSTPVPAVEGKGRPYLAALEEARYLT